MISVTIPSPSSFTVVSRQMIQKDLTCVQSFISPSSCATARLWLHQWTIFQISRTIDETTSTCRGMTRISPSYFGEVQRPETFIMGEMITTGETRTESDFTTSRTTRRARGTFMSSRDGLVLGKCRLGRRARSIKHIPMSA